MATRQATAPASGNVDDPLGELWAGSRTPDLDRATPQEGAHGPDPQPDGCGTVFDPVTGALGAAVEADRASLLDLHKGIVDPRRGCGRWPEGLFLRPRVENTLMRGRCRATNLCRYCQTLYVLETVEMLLLDASEYAPSLWAVLTAREHLTRADLRRHLDAVRKAARKRWPDIEWFVQVEFQRRGALHANLLIKGVPVEDLEQLREVVVGRWCDRVDAEPPGQWLGAIEDEGGVVRYLQKTLSHGLKSEQAPPIGWKGHRTSQTRGYFVRSAAVMRQEAKRSRALKRELWRAEQQGLEAHDAELFAHEAVEAADAIEWELVKTLEYAPSSAPVEASARVSVPAGQVEAVLWNRKAREAARAWRAADFDVLDSS